MYVPAHFEENRRDVLDALIQAMLDVAASRK